MSAPDLASDDSTDPPTAERVAKRAIVLTVVSCRGFLDADPAGEPLWTQARGWFADLGADVDDELEPAERVVIDAPFGSLSPRDRVLAGWRCEGLAVLAWALRRFDLPDFDVQVPGRAPADALGFLQPREVSVLADPRLRPLHEVVALAEGLFAVHWRVVEAKVNPGAMDFRSFAETAYFGPLSLDLARLAEDGDLAIGESSVATADPRAVQQVEAIASERHRAANWLLGWDEVYSEVDTST